MADESADHPKDPFPRGDTPAPGMTQGPLIEPEFVTKERERKNQALRDAQPSFIRNPRDNRVTVAPASPLLDYPRAIVEASPRQPAFPPEINALTQENQIAGTFPNIALLLSDATTTEGDPPVESNKVAVFDGKIKGEFPTGMGSGNYVIDLSNPEDSLIYAGATFDPSTLLLTSRFLGVSTSTDFPESRVETTTLGFVYWLLGFTYFNADGAFTIVQTRLGNIDFEFSYGAFNGQPAILPMDTGPGWLDLVGLFP